MQLIKLCDNPEWAEHSAEWFSDKWGIPAEAYSESIHSCIRQKNTVPQWYIMVKSDTDIIAGAGVIENDFHDRKDLEPNLCALYVEEEYRRQGIARYILDFIRRDLKAIGFERLYLLTEHTAFYEKCGWEYHTLVNDNEGSPMRIYLARL